MKTIHLFLLSVLGCASGNVANAQNWPQAAGPHGDWSTQTEVEVPASFNVVSGETVLWTKPMEESGQSGIVVWEDRLFLTILKPFEAKPETAFRFAV